MKDYKVIINKSTVPVGTAERTKEAIAKNATVEFDVVSNPEFLREGVAVDDFMKPDRVVVGTTSERARKLMEELYRPFVRQGNPIIFMDERSSEMTKYAANSYLAVRISFMNELQTYAKKPAQTWKLSAREWAAITELERDSFFLVLVMAEVAFQKMYRH